MGLVYVAISLFALIYAFVGFVFYPLPLMYAAFGWILGVALIKIVDEIIKYYKDGR